MEARKLTALTASMMLANMTAEQVAPRRWEASNNSTKPQRKAKKDRSKIKAARKQRSRK